MAGDGTVSCPQGDNVIWNLIIQFMDNLEGELPGAIFTLLPNLGQIDISSAGLLKGGIPSEIRTLSELQYLILGRNTLTGAIPSEVGQFLIGNVWHSITMP